MKLAETVKIHTHRETDKALLISLERGDSGLGRSEIWIPKSAIKIAEKEIADWYVKNQSLYWAEAPKGVN